MVPALFEDGRGEIRRDCGFPVFREHYSIDFPLSTYSIDFQVLTTRKFENSTLRLKKTGQNFQAQQTGYVRCGPYAIQAVRRS